MEFFNIDETFISRVQTTALGKGAVKNVGELVIFVDRENGYGREIDDGRIGTSVWSRSNGTVYKNDTPEEMQIASARSTCGLK